MHEEKEVSADSVREGYETSDMNIKIIAAFGVVLTIMVVSTIVTIVIVMRGFEDSRQPISGVIRSPLEAGNTETPTGARLQQDPVKDKAAILSAAEHHLARFGVVSEEPGLERGHVPVSLAIEWVAEGKMPYRQTPQAALAETADTAAAPAQQ